MPTRDNLPVGAPVWVDLFTTDPDRARAFYGEIFGWTSEDAGEEFGHYINFSRNGTRVAGGMRNDGASGRPDSWSVYLSTADAEATVAKATSHGGQVAIEPMQVGELGTMAYVIDAGGAMIGMWQPAEFGGIGLQAEHGAPSWFELHTRDYDASVQFYHDVFGWTTEVASATAEFRYTTLSSRDQQYAGIMDASGFLPEGVPAQWSIYFGVDDTDKALARIVDLGGAVVTPAEDTPYGRLATATDPTGAEFKLIHGNQDM
jgi:uncharacterized protein